MQCTLHYKVNVSSRCFGFRRGLFSKKIKIPRERIVGVLSKSMKPRERNTIMSCVCILTPVVIAAWPAFSAAVVSAATSLGYQVISESFTCRDSAVADTSSRRVELEVEQSELVTGPLGRNQKLRVARDTVIVSFARDARGRATICVEGKGCTDAELRAAGEELSERAVQRYVYERLMTEMEKRQFVVVEEEVDERHAIRLKVRHWEN